MKEGICESYFIEECVGNGDVPANDAVIGFIEDIEIHYQEHEYFASCLYHSSTMGGATIIVGPPFLTLIVENSHSSRLLATFILYHEYAHISFGYPKTKWKYDRMYACQQGCVHNEEYTCDAYAAQVMELDRVDICFIFAHTLKLEDDAKTKTTLRDVSNFY